jgi:hypothetical protein
MRDTKGLSTDQRATHGGQGYLAPYSYRVYVLSYYKLFVHDRTTNVDNSCLGLSAATQTTPKFGPRLRHRRQLDQNAFGRWARFLQRPGIFGPIQTTAVHLRRAARDGLTL